MIGFGGRWLVISHRLFAIHICNLLQGAFKCLKGSDNFVSLGFNSPLGFRKPGFHLTDHFCLFGVLSLQCF
ncbi:hypothetical protein IP70_16485 [alpha proteobacterium AAP38]|nr:hypothetical protein IP70_16485 [alpha proteobacterium AAP38]